MTTSEGHVGALAPDRKLPAPMLYVSPIVEALRGRPRLVFWTVTLTQAIAWFLVPSLFYASPPGDVPLVLAIGHEWQLGSVYGPPLAFWLGELAFRMAGSSVFGVYLLSQACVVLTYWAIFTLGRSIVGASHAALAVLLMVGISAFAAPTPDFGPTVVAMALTALALLFYWRAVGEGHRRSFIPLGVVLGLLLLTTYYAVLLFAMMVVFMAATERGRMVFQTLEVYLVIPIMVLVALPHLVWLAQAVLSGAVERTSLVGVIWLKQLLNLLVDHAGVLVMVIVGGALMADRKTAVPELVREPVDNFAKLFVYVFALVPAALATLISAIRGQAGPLGGDAALIVLSGLAVVVLAGDVIRLHRQPLVGLTFIALLIGPPLLAVAAVVVLPWTFGTELKVSEPGPAMGRFFTESFNRRTGKPLAIVAGDARLGGLVAMMSPQRPSLLLDGDFRRSPWVSEADLRENGAIVVWPLTDLAGTPPPELKARFPDLVPEVPRGFERAIQGRLPLLRIGWAMMRPQQAPSAQ